jgi:polyisoprenoid-binding protein YceI
MFVGVIAVGQSTESNALSYEVDKNHTNIGFSVRHMLLAKVYGKFEDYSIDLNWDNQNPTNSFVEVRIQVASINTDNQKRDNHLRGPDFFDAVNYPEIVFKSEKIEKTDDGYIAHGKLTMRDVTRDVVLPFNLIGSFKQKNGKIKVGIEAGMNVNRMDYHISWDKIFDTGGLVAGEEVEIDIQAEFVSS